jgi:starch synthase
MLEKKRLLIVTQDLDPFTEISSVGIIAGKLPKLAGETYDIRILMPRFPSINERRHRLHEVVRLSGMNIIVAGEDFPLLIKVASLPGTRLQVYFLDNEEFFKRDYDLIGPTEADNEDNPHRAIFFCKGVMEIVKKFGWTPNIIHCHGWFSSLVPAYLKTAYKLDPIFANAKVVYSAYTDDPQPPIDKTLVPKASINNLDSKQLTPYAEGFHNGAYHFADGIIEVGDDITEGQLPKVKTKKQHYQHGLHDTEELWAKYAAMYKKLGG